MRYFRPIAGMTSKPGDHGPYVRTEDYEKVVAENARLRAEIEKMRREKK